MVTDLEQRIKKLDKKVPELPCPNPEHREYRFFMQGLSREQDQENERRIQEIKHCEHCKDKSMVVLIFQRFAQPGVWVDGLENVETKEKAYSFEIGDGEPVNASRETPSVSHPDIEVMKWLEELSKECNEDA